MVFRTIFDHIRDSGVFFVFPSETAAAGWAEKICIYGGVRSVAANRFIAWDRFKERTVRAEAKDRKPVSSLTRRLFARCLARENAASPFLSAIIPVDFAESGEIFAPSIAMLLSSLAFWEERQGTGADDEEDRDLRIIKSKYAAFMHSSGLFEPAWEKTPFREDGGRYIVFFPEVLSDFTEYRDLLLSRGVTIYSADNSGERQKLLFFESARTEIQSAVLELRRLHEEEGLPYEEMAVSLPGFKDIEPYVTRELALYDIPFSLRAGKSLGEYPMGRFFSLAGECTASDFSFDSLKALLLNANIPWKDREMNRLLIRFGIENHCVASFYDRGRLADAWEEGFKRRPGEEAAAAYYRKLKEQLCAMTGGKSFREIEEQYFVFREFLDMEKCSAENNAVLARCVEELSVLAETEEEFPFLADPDPYGFFVSHLEEKNYVHAREGGVNIYDYPVAAGAPFRCHMVLNVSQAAASVQQRPLSFLRQDKRVRLGMEDRDVSAPLLSLYNIPPWNDYKCQSRISASEKTFAGWAIPHSAFALNTETVFPKTAHAGETPEDPFIAERRWWAGTSGTLNRLCSVQHEGFAEWSRILAEPGPDSGKEAPPSDPAELSAMVSRLLHERIRNKNIRELDSAETAVPRELSVSATDLNEFFTCPLLWLNKRILRLEPYAEDAALLDDAQRGLLYHEILYRLFKRIKDTDKRFMGKNIESYFDWLTGISALVLKSDSALRGPLVYPLLSSLAASMNRRIRALLKTEAVYFSGFEVRDLEKQYSLPRGSLYLTGRIDRISALGNEVMIIDYKTSNPPPGKKSRLNSGMLKDFQIPMYIKLYEESEKEKVSRAFFIGINEHKIVPVIGRLEGKRDYYSRDDYEPSMAELEKAIEQFESAIAKLSFIPEKIPYKTCFSCTYKTICRFCYSLSSAGPEPLYENRESENEEEESHGFPASTGTF